MSNAVYFDFFLNSLSMNKSLFSNYVSILNVSVSVLLIYSYEKKHFCFAEVKIEGLLKRKEDTPYDLQNSVRFHVNCFK